MSIAFTFVTEIELGRKSRFNNRVIDRSDRAFFLELIFYLLEGLDLSTGGLLAEFLDLRDLLFGCELEGVHFLLFCLLDQSIKIGDWLSLVEEVKGHQFGEPIFHFLFDKGNSVGCGGQFIQFFPKEDLDSDTHNMIIHQEVVFYY